MRGSHVHGSTLRQKLYSPKSGGKPKVKGAISSAPTMAVRSSKKGIAFERSNANTVMTNVMQNHQTAVRTYET